MATAPAASLPPEPRVTIGLPVFNGERFLAEAITSAANQTRPPEEILVFDNASTDRTLDVARFLLPPASVHTSVSNLGAVANFNRAVDAASGEFFAWLAADDRLAPTFIETCLQALAQHPDRPACLPGIQFIDERGAHLRQQSDAALGSQQMRMRARSFLRRPRWTEVYCLYRRPALMESPRFTADYGTDVLLTWWFLLRGPLAVVDEPLLVYREYSNKTVAEMAASLMPGSATQGWRKLRMWRRLWAMTGDDGVPRASAWAARAELVLWWTSGSWWGHLREDISIHIEARGGPLLTATWNGLRALRERMRGRRSER